MGFGLRITGGQEQGREFHFGGGSINIGRLPNNDLVLQDSGVSRLHCIISEAADGFLLRDNDSANGTLVNDVICRQARINDGDRIQIGATVFEFLAKNSTEDMGQTLQVSGLGRHAFAVPIDNKERRATRALGGGIAGGRRSLASDDDAPLARTAETRSSRWRLPRRTLIACGGAALVLVLGGGIALWRLMHPPVADRSNEVFALDDRVAQESFGFGHVDVLCADRVNFSFETHGGRVTVVYSAAGIDSPSEVQILVNSQEAGYVPVSAGKWTTGIRFVLPRHTLRPGINLLTFDNRINPPGEEHWGIAEVSLLEEALPPPDTARAQQLYDLGRAAFDTRSVAPQNLSRAQTYFETARRYVEAIDPEPPLVGLIDDWLRRTHAELDSVYETHLFAVEKAQHFGDVDGAVESLRELLRYFPNVEDARNREIKDRLATLTGQTVP